MFLSSEKSVMEELKTNLGKKMITSFGLTPSPSKHKQLITSDITLPIYEVSSKYCSRLDGIRVEMCRAVEWGAFCCTKALFTGLLCYCYSTSLSWQFHVEVTSTVNCYNIHTHMIPLFSLTRSPCPPKTRYQYTAVRQTVMKTRTGSLSVLKGRKTVSQIEILLYVVSLS